jgi:two-component system NtrC family sensor kinase
MKAESQAATMATENTPPCELDREEVERIRAKLVDASRMAALGGLMASIVHEINTPIGSILSNNEVMLRSLNAIEQKIAASPDADSPGLKKALSIIEMMRGLASVDKIACERISSVVRGLKTFSRADDGQPRETDLHEQISDTLKLVSCQYRQRIRVETDFGDLPPVECYPQLLNQVFLNVLVNAGQAIEGEGVVTVRTRREGEMVRVSISDTGHGIPPDRMAKLFQTGFTTKPVGVGTGLGLSISRQIIDKHHGRIEVESAEGAGTTFHILVPIRQQPPNRGAAREGEST